ncbi:MAG: ABC transporter ATP-binding protein [Anderseniella sp.]
MPEPHIVLENVHKTFGTKHVLKGINVGVGRGRSLVVIGGSGSGKSVTLKCILGLLHPERGSIRVDGQEIIGLQGNALDEMMCRFGMLFQGAALFDSLSVWRNVAFGLIQGRKMKPADARVIAIDKLAEVGLGAELADISPAELSGGMRKRVGLARAIAPEPEIIFFDEPTTGLDPIMGDVINNLIVDSVKHLGATTITITHDMASARKIGDDIAMIYKGKIVWCGPADEIDQSNNPYVDQFIHGREEGPIEIEL